MAIENEDDLVSVLKQLDKEQCETFLKALTDERLKEIIGPQLFSDFFEKIKW